MDGPFSLVWGFFIHNIRIYEYFNTGWWYDFLDFTLLLSGVLKAY